MKTPLIILIVGLFSCITNLSCSEDDSFAFISETSSMSSSIFNKGDVSKLNTPLELKGQFNIWKSSSGETVFYTENESSINIFICDNCNDNFYDFENNGILTFIDHSFVYKSGNEKYYFAVSKPEEKYLKKEFNLEFHKEKEFYGEGVIFYKLNKNIKEVENDFLLNLRNSENNMLFIASVLDNISSRGVEPPSCNSGGEGSTGCSSTSGANSCSVSCATGYYSCCNDGASCGCYDSITHILKAQNPSTGMD